MPLPRLHSLSCFRIFGIYNYFYVLIFPIEFMMGASFFFLSSPPNCGAMSAGQYSNIDRVSVMILVTFQRNTIPSPERRKTHRINGFSARTFNWLVLEMFGENFNFMQINIRLLYFHANTQANSLQNDTEPQAAIKSRGYFFFYYHCDVRLWSAIFVFIFLWSIWVKAVKFILLLKQWWLEHL